MNIKNLILVLFTSFMLSGCMTAILFTGSAVGLGYMANDVQENYNGDGGAYFEDKTDSFLDFFSAN